ncbi:toxin co-regulated pilus biosynthesis Q family protein [Burkholderia glumae]|uniref:toxin co-regulated pilus biosynthesis Q family protein n=1 Tax=Burkholderia glumae TaxID=337 RepID=UPI0020CF775E|nr:TcpQ domain-containing protein [Burkholderia glumae]MCQ0031470.1 TcpQ domain-containing protein [Burkholderia glumae]MCQ0035122.1 TcpQ domain-containing protein [Burkholderia glumae]
MSDFMMPKPLPQPMRDARWPRAAIAGLASLVIGSATAAPAIAPVEQFQADPANRLSETGWNAVDATTTPVSPAAASNPATSPAPSSIAADVHNTAFAARPAPPQRVVSVPPSVPTSSSPPSLSAKPSFDGGSSPADMTAAVRGAETYRLEAGLPIDEQLRDWARRAGWTLLWNLEPGWIVPGAQDFGTDFRSAMDQAISSLADNGADVRGDGYQANHVFIVHHKGTN